MSNSVLAELKRRNVFKAGVAYLALGWVVVQITATLMMAARFTASRTTARIRSTARPPC